MTPPERRGTHMI